MITLLQHYKYQWTNSDGKSLNAGYWNRGLAQYLVAMSIGRIIYFQAKFDPGQDGQCTAIIYIHSKTSTWKIVPCNAKIAFEWICKQQLTTRSVLYHRKYPTFICCSKCISILERCFRPLPGFTFHQRQISNTTSNTSMSQLKTLEYLTVDAMQNYTSHEDFSEDGMFLDANVMFGPLRLASGQMFKKRNILNKTPSCRPNSAKCYNDICRAQTFLCTKGLSCAPKICACILNGFLSLDSFFCLSKCQLETCKCPPLMFQCSDSGCIPYDYVCNGESNCNDSSDEFCKFDIKRVSAAMTIDERDNSHSLTQFKRCFGFMCHSSRCISINLVNDLIPDCVEAEDESHGLNQKYYGSTYHCEAFDEIPCVPNHSKCFEIHQLCVYDHDELGHIAYCRDGSHLFNCELIECTNAYKCPNSFCVPLRKVCDGIPDCLEGEDEISCENNVCPGYLKCTTVEFCLHPLEVCDGFPQCPNGDDEIFCDVRRCPAQCDCLGHSAVCRRENLRYIPVMLTENLIYLSIGLTLMDVPFFSNFTYLTELVILDLSESSIVDICSAFQDHYAFYKTLLVLDLKYNNIHYLTSNCFGELESLVSLNLRDNPLENIADDAFQDVTLHLLTISYTKMHTLSRYWLQGFSKIRTLDIRGVFLNDISTSSKKVLDTLDSIFTNDERLYCILHHSNFDNIKSIQLECPRILPHASIGLMFLCVGTSVLMFNVVSILVNAKIFRGRKPTRFLLNGGLIVGGILQGIYVMTIAAADIIVGRKYILVMLSWESIFLCSTGSTILCMGLALSNMASMMLDHAAYSSIISVIYNSDEYYIHWKKIFVVLVNVILMVFASLAVFQNIQLFNASHFDGLCNAFGNISSGEIALIFTPALLAIIMVATFVHTVFTNYIIFQYAYSSGRHIQELSTLEFGNQRRICFHVSRSVLKSTALRMMECLPIPFLVLTQVGGHQVNQLLQLGAIMVSISIGGFCNVFRSVWSPFISSKMRK